MHSLAGPWKPRGTSPPPPQDALLPRLPLPLSLVPVGLTPWCLRAPIHRSARTWVLFSCDWVSGLCDYQTARKPLEGREQFLWPHHWQSCLFAGCALRCACVRCIHLELWWLPSGLVSWLLCGFAPYIIVCLLLLAMAQCMFFHPFIFSLSMWFCLRWSLGSRI